MDSGRKTLMVGQSPWRQKLEDHKHGGLRNRHIGGPMRVDMKTFDYMLTTTREQLPQKRH